MTVELLELIAKYFHRRAKEFADNSPESDTFVDAADAVSDARDLLVELGE